LKALNPTLIPQELSLAQAYNKSIFPLLGEPTDVKGTPAEPYLVDKNGEALCEVMVDASKCQLETDDEDATAYDKVASATPLMIRWPVPHRL
jgi:hypothetical protein